MKKVLIIAADGFEEIEMLAVADILRRLEVQVTIAALPDEFAVTGAHQITVQPDALFSEVDTAAYDALFLPGGMPGAANLYASDAVVELVRQMHSAGKIVSAICAAPIVLAKAGVLTDGAFTIYPGFEKYLNGLHATGEAAAAAGNVITGKGPGAVFDFTALLVQALGLADECSALYPAMFIK